VSNNHDSIYEEMEVGLTFIQWKPTTFDSTSISLQIIQSPHMNII